MTSSLPNAIANPALDRAATWLLHSGIQQANGGVARYYLADSRRNLPLSTEITGYAAGALVFLHHSLGSPECLRGATAAGHHLTRMAWNADAGTMPFETETAPAYAYFFDCGIVVRGLLSLWRATGEQEFLSVAIRVGDFMRRAFPNGEPGRFHPILQLPDATPVPYERRWSREPGCYQLKSALALRDLHEVTGHAESRAVFEEALAAALANDSEFLPGDDDPNRVMDRLHAYGYYLEGLLSVMERPACREALAQGISRMGRLLRELAAGFERSDACAQLLRVRLWADASGAVPLDELAAAREAARVESYQCVSGDRSLDGGYWFGRRDGRLLPFMNPVSTAFCLQARELWRRRLAGEPLPGWQGLV